MSQIQTSIKLRQELYSIAHAAVGCAFLALVLAGVAGTIYKVISPEGWVAQAFGRSLSAGVLALGAITVIAGVAWFSRSWGDPRNRNRASDVLVYGFAAAGLFYGAQYMRGTF